MFDECFSVNPTGELSSNKVWLITVITSLVRTILTYWLNNKKGYGPIKASAISAFIVAIPLPIVPVSGFIALFPIVFYGASFVGMSNDKILGWLSVVASSVLFAIIFHFAHPYFNGYGVALGVKACLSCLIGILLQKAFYCQTVGVQTKTRDDPFTHW